MERSQKNVARMDEFERLGQRHEDSINELYKRTGRPGGGSYGDDRDAIGPDCRRTPPAINHGSVRRRVRGDARRPLDLRGSPSAAAWVRR